MELAQLIEINYLIFCFFPELTLYKIAICSLQCFCHFIHTYTDISNIMKFEKKNRIIFFIKTVNKEYHQRISRKSYNELKFIYIFYVICNVYMFFKNKMNKNRKTIESNSHAFSFSSPIEFQPPNRSVIINITARQIVQMNFENDSNIWQTKPPFMIEANNVT